ncbi:MAG: ABC transporter permease [Balneolaceae bacterium]|nr:ABC transporter permease [Balneolaceae bacterium]MBO6547791.1 ABC transporter permease [Balneolaceae bacterium]MBO6648302.1 ABC transporter permease [Balneolaceae bacterium]
MLKNYLKIAFRNILKNKFYSFLNILGLAIGITSAVLIIIYVQDELSYDNFQPNVENKYVIGLEGKIGSQEIKGIFTPPILAGTIMEEIPGIVSTTRTNSVGDIVFRYNDNSFTEKNVFWADSNFYDYFGYRLLEGDPETVLKGPNKAVLTESIARKYFGDLNPIGKTILIGNNQTVYEVTGVNADPPSNTHFTFDALLSYSSSQFSRSTVWSANSINTYVEVHPTANPEQVEASFDDLVMKYVSPELEQFMGASVAQMREQGNQYKYFQVAISDLHLKAPDVNTSFQPPGDITYVYIFSIIGIFLVVIACVNFMNLSTASAAGRAKEVGLRKTMGGERGGMISQFLIESVAYVVLAAILSIALIYFAMPFFNNLSGKELTFAIISEPWFIATLIGMIVFVGFLAGSYPALYLTAFNPVDVLKGKIKRAAKSGKLRQSLVVGQFFISIGLISCTILVNEQLQYMQNRNLGINKEQSIVLTNTSRLGNNLEAFKENLLQDTRVIAASYSNFTIPGTNNITIFQRPTTDLDYVMAMYYADYEHREALDFEMTGGRFFSRDFPTDTLAMVLNEAAVKELGFQEDVVGEEVLFSNDGRTYKVIGVMKDFNFQSLREEIMPLAILLTETANEMTIRFQTEDPRDAIAMIESKWDEYSAGEPIDYTFLDEDFDQLFRQELRLGAVFTAFTIIAIIIACLGLLGLSAYMAEQRTKEIGVRKVLGASVGSILGLLSKEFIKLISIAFVLAIPLSWYFIQSWLENFAYRVEISPMIFVYTGLVTLGIVLLTISWQSLKAANLNPVESIQTE